MDMFNVVAVFFTIIIILTFISLVNPELPSDMNNALSVLVIIFSLIAIFSVVLSRNKSFYPY